MIEIARRNRGAVSEEEIIAADAISTSVLIEMLRDSNPCTRSIAAVVLGRRREGLAIESLCEALSVEKSLYTKMYICEALVDIGIATLPILINYIGRIGRNQHSTLPSKPFNKLSYPLPRDIVVRTIVRMGREALPLLRATLLVASEEIVRELIDAIGHISFYSKDTTSLTDLIHILRKFPNDVVIKWKVIRALQAFPQKESIDILELSLREENERALKNEALRGLKISGTR